MASENKTDPEDDRYRTYHHPSQSGDGGYSSLTDDGAFEKQTWQQKFYIFYVTAIGAIGGLLFGYDTGVVSGALLQIDADFHLTDIEKESIVSIAVLGAILGASCSGYVSNRIGRKSVVMIASVIFVCGAILMGVAHTLTALLLGRLTVGIGIGQASMVVPMYIAEMAPSEYRGRLVTVNTLFITGGQFVAALVDGAFSDQQGGWRWMLGLGAVPAAIQFVGLFGLPESPRYLINRGKVHKARLALIKLRGQPARKKEKTSYGTENSAARGIAKSACAAHHSESSAAAAANFSDRETLLNKVEEDAESSVSGSSASTATRRNEPTESRESPNLRYSEDSTKEDEEMDPIELELQEIQDAVRDEVKQQQALIGITEEGSTKHIPQGLWSKIQAYYNATKRMFASPAVRRALLVGCVLQMLQQFAGINTVMYYSGTILHNAGFDSKMAIWLTAVVAFTNFVFSGLGLRFVETSGRRKLTLFSVTGVTISLLLLGSVFFVKRQYSATAISPSGKIPSQGHCGTFGNCGDCVINDKCGFLGNESFGYCLEGNVDKPSNFEDSFPKTYQWEFSRCLGSIQTDLGWAALACLTLYLMCFAPGLASTPWTVNSEIYPTQVRASAVSIATTVNWISNLVISMTFLSLAAAITSFGAFCLYAAISFAAGIFLYFRLPETKGKTLEEIQELFTRNS